MTGPRTGTGPGPGIGLRTGPGPETFSAQQSSFVVPAICSLVPGVFMSGTLEILYWKMRVQLASGPMGPMGGWVTRKQ